MVTTGSPSGQIGDGGAWDNVGQSCVGRPWNVLPQDQGDHPPEGEWVSRKGSKSYVYSLVYV